MNRQFELMGGGVNLDDLPEDEKAALVGKMNDFRKHMEVSLEERMRNHFRDNYDQFDAYHQSITMRQKLQASTSHFMIPWATMRAKKLSAS